MKSTKILLVAALLILGTSQAMAQAQPFDLGQALSSYQTVSQQFGQAIAGVAKKLAIILFTIDLAWMVSSKMLKGADLPEILTTVVMRSMWLGFLFFLMNADVMTSVIQGFKQLGAQGSGLQVFSPGDVFWEGIELVGIMTTKFAEGANIAGVPVPAGVAAAANPLVAMTLGLSIIVIVLAYLIMTAQYIAIVLQMYFYLACYPILLAMGATKFGNDMSMKAISAAIVIGVRFLAMYFVLSIAHSMSGVMGTQLASLSIANLAPMWAVFGMAGLLAFLAMKVPQMASDLLGGTASLSGGDAVAAGAAAGGAVAAAGGVMGAAGGSLSGALQAGGAAINQAQAAGATGVAGTMAGAAGALARGVGGAAADGIRSLGSGSTGGNLAGRIDATTAGIQEAKAAGGAGTVPAPSSPPPTSGGGGQPPAPPADSGSSGSSAGQAAAPSVQTSSGAAATPPAPAAGGSESSSPTQTSSTGNTTAGAAGGGSVSSAPAGSGFSPQPAAPPIDAPQSEGGVGGMSSSQLVQELKSADTAQGASVQISPPAHD